MSPIIKSFINFFFVLSALALSWISPSSAQLRAVTLQNDTINLFSRDSSPAAVLFVVNPCHQCLEAISLFWKENLPARSCSSAKLICLASAGASALSRRKTAKDLESLFPSSSILFECADPNYAYNLSERYGLAAAFNVQQSPALLFIDPGESNTTYVNYEALFDKEGKLSDSGRLILCQFLK